MAVKTLRHGQESEGHLKMRPEERLEEKQNEIHGRLFSSKRSNFEVEIGENYKSEEKQSSREFGKGV